MFKSTAHEFINGLIDMATADWLLIPIANQIPAPDWLLSAVAVQIPAADWLLSVAVQICAADWLLGVAVHMAGWLSQLAEQLAGVGPRGAQPGMVLQKLGDVEVAALQGNLRESGNKNYRKMNKNIHSRKENLYSNPLLTLWISYRLTLKNCKKRFLSGLL